MQCDENKEKAGKDDSKTCNLLKTGTALVNAGKFDEAIDKLEDALRTAVGQVDNELDYSLAKYYYAYGDAIIAKLTNSTELFGEAVQEAITKKEGEIVEEIKKEEEDEKAVVGESESEEDCKIEVVKDHEEEDEKAMPLIPPSANPSSGNKKPAELEEQTEDVQIAWENMETARVIAEKRRNEVSKDSEAYKEAAKLAARIYMSIGEILSMQEREEEALQEFTKALALRLEVEKADSRELAETYFTLGSTILRGRGKERSAIENFQAAARILEDNLYRVLKISSPAQEERKMEPDASLVTPQTDDSPQVKELREVLAAVYIKVEDAILQEKELPELKKVMEQKGEEESKEGFDKGVFVETKPVDLGVLGKAKKRAVDETRREEEKNGGEKKQKTEEEGEEDK